MTVYRMNAGTVGVEKAQGEQIKERSALGERKKEKLRTEEEAIYTSGPQASRG